MTESYKVMSLFSGMGGMDVGFAEETVVHKNSIFSPDYTDETSDFVRLKRLPFEIVFQNDILPEAKRIAELTPTKKKNETKQIKYKLLNVINENKIK